MEATIVDIVSRIWSCYADAKVKQCSASERSVIKAADQKYASGIDITGESEHYRAYVCMEASVAKQFMMRMTHMEEAAIGEEEKQIMSDELANLVAGNIKPILRGSDTLHLPESVETEGKVIQDFGADLSLVYLVEFDTEFGFFQFALFKH